MATEKENSSSAIGSGVEFDKLSIPQLLGVLNLGQLWAVIGILAGLIGGSFAGGYWLSGVVRSAEINGLEIKLAGANANLEAKTKELDSNKQELSNYKKKDRFLSLLLRYTEAPGDEQIKTALDEYVIKFIESADKADSIVKAGKGQWRQTTVTFWDGSKWTIPLPLKASALE